MIIITVASELETERLAAQKLLKALLLSHGIAVHAGGHIRRAEGIPKDLPRANLTEEEQLRLVQLQLEMSPAGQENYVCLQVAPITLVEAEETGLIQQSDRKTRMTERQRELLRLALGFMSSSLDAVKESYESEESEDLLNFNGTRIEAPTEKELDELLFELQG